MLAAKPGVIMNQRILASTLDRASTWKDKLIVVALDEQRQGMRLSEEHGFTEELKMTIEIRKLIPDLAEDYINFFENGVNEDCYCTCYCSDDHEGKDFHSKELRREYAIKYIQSGKIQGYLAYEEGQVVGWCNANRKADCLNCEGWKRILSSVNTTDSGIHVKSVFCFTIAPDVRRKGIASSLLERVCNDAMEEGFDCVEAYPNKEFIDVYYDHMGPMNLYRKHGFEVMYETPKKAVMIKGLK